jgi:hypothetical protein
MVELRRVVEDQHWTTGCRKTIMLRLKVAAHDVCFADLPTAEAALGYLRVGPVLAIQRNTLAHGAPHLFQQYTKSTAKPCILESVSGNLASYPCYFIVTRRAIEAAQSKRRHRHTLNRLHDILPCSESGAQQ